MEIDNSYLIITRSMLAVCRNRRTDSFIFAGSDSDSDSNLKLEVQFT